MEINFEANVDSWIKNLNREVNILKQENQVSKRVIENLVEQNTDLVNSVNEIKLVNLIMLGNPQLINK